LCRRYAAGKSLLEGSFDKTLMLELVRDVVGLAAVQLECS
jgi:hypothetical protein